MNEIILDWEKYLQKSKETVCEGCVLLKNEDVLPFSKNSSVSIFGRIQLHYYKSGTGSGGMVNVSKVTGILDAIKQSNFLKVNEELENIYRNWDLKEPFDGGTGWGNEPWCQKEMPLTDKIVKDARKKSENAIIIIGRTAGEDKDSENKEGSYLLTKTEENMIKKVRKYFDKVCVLLNVGSIIDMNFVQKFKIPCVMYVWQGGMNGGDGVCDLICGKANPSGKLTDTIAKSIKDYPSFKNFGDETRNFYEEDIYVGYRYFETFKKDKVLYPFGFGLSYTTFKINAEECETSFDSLVLNKKIKVNVIVKNTGKFSGKETVQLYAECPQAKLGKPSRILIGFKKTKLLNPLETQKITLEIPFSRLSSYDDSGVTGFESSWVLEQGEYKFYLGNDVRSAFYISSFNLEKTVLIQKLSQALSPTIPFKRLKPCQNQNNLGFSEKYEDVPVCKKDMDEKRLENIPEEISYTGDKGIKLSDVKENKFTMNNFIAQFSEDDLCCIVRGEGMGSLKVTLGTASAFGGVSENLKNFGLPCVCCDDGPSGLRLDTGAKAFNIPNGTLLASTFNEELVEELFDFVAKEMIYNKVECLLGPAMNIHRFPLNGRNFEYFSEDPLVTALIATSQLKALHKNNVSGTIKHFCANNQEKRRHFVDSAVSERALREIYLKGFEIAVKEGNADSIMTTYGSVNGRWTAGSYDLNTTILRNEWGFTGIVMTDWFASINDFGKPQDKTNFCAMIKSQNDLYMVCPDSSYASTGDNLEISLKNKKLTKAELQRSAKNICNFIMNSQAMKRFLGNSTEVKIINKNEEQEDLNFNEKLLIYKMNENFSLDFDERLSKAKADFAFALEFEKKGMYEITLEAKSNSGELSQLPCTLFFGGIPVATYTFTGTSGKTSKITKTLPVQSDYTTVRINISCEGLKLTNFKCEFFRNFNEDDKKLLYWL